MKKVSIFLTAITISLILAVSPVYCAGEYGRICGTVTCESSGEPLAAVNIYLKNTHFGAATNTDGSYCIYRIPPGVYTVLFKMMGYETREVKKTEVRADEVVTLDISLCTTILEYDQCITVTSTRGPSLITDVPASVNVINTDKPEYGNAQNLGEILQNIQGVYIKDSGGLGNTKTISLRGSSSGQVVILLDGQRINNPQTGLVDLSTLSLEGVKSVEVVRGSNSALYGADAIGGVVNIITRDNNHQDTGLKGSVKSTAASFGTRSFESNLSFAAPVWDVSASGKILSSEGDFTFTDNYGTEKIRENADIESKDFHIRAGIKPGEQAFMRQLELNYRHNRSERGAPGTIEPYYYKARMWDRNNQLNFLYSGKTFSFRHDLRWQNYYYDSWSRYFNDESAQKVDTRFKTRTYGSEIQLRSILREWTTLTYGSGIRFDNVEDYQELTDRLRTSSYLFFVSENLFTVNRFGLSRISLVPSVRYDFNSDYPDKLSPKIGTVLNFGKKWTISLKMNTGMSFRAPTFNDLYWPEDAWTRGNPDLKPESGWDWDMGARLFFPVLNGINIESTLFDSRMSDLILWQENAGLWTPDNVQKARIKGLENSVQFSPWKEFIHINANYTYMDARNLTKGSAREENKILVYRPKHTGNITTTFTRHPVNLIYQYQYVSRSFTDATNVWNNSLSPYHLSNMTIGVVKTIKQISLEMNLQLKNIFDQDYRAVKNMPVPGREWRISLKVEKK